MALWISPTTVDQPDVILTGWAVFEVLLPEIGHRTLHFVGDRAGDAEGRVSSPIESTESASRCGVSRSRVYQLAGEPGLGGDAQYVWARWLRIWDAGSRELQG